MGEFLRGHFSAGIVFPAHRQPVKSGKNYVSLLAPIVLFVHARPDHTRRTLEALARNPESRESLLYIFADGETPSASEVTRAKISRVRAILREKPWCGEVRITESETNRGLADSIVGGVTEVVRRHGRVIVLEDDIELGQGALSYFNRALSLYENDDRVMQVSGFMVKMPPWAAPTGFLRMTTSWGWATWDRAWNHYDGDAVGLRKRIEASCRDAFDLDGASFHFEELCRNVRGELKTWAVKWYASVFLSDGLCLYPKKSVLRNIGFDGSGENCESDGTNYFTKLPVARNIRLHRRPLVEAPFYLKAMRKSFQYRLQVWTGTRFRDRLAKKWRAVTGGI